MKFVKKYGQIKPFKVIFIKKKMLFIMKIKDNSVIESISLRFSIYLNEMVDIKNMTFLMNTKCRNYIIHFN